MTVNARSGAHCLANLTHTHIHTNRYMTRQIADSMQFIREFLANIDETKTKVVALLSDIKTWMRERKLKPNESKTGDRAD